jgi:hypothetical protein
VRQAAHPLRLRLGKSSIPSGTAAHLLRDRDTIYGDSFPTHERPADPRRAHGRPQARQNPFVDRLTGSNRRDCLDHIVVLSERHLRSVLTGCRVEGSRGTHAPVSRPRPIERRRQFSRTPLSCQLRVSSCASPVFLRPDGLFTWRAHLEVATRSLQTPQRALTVSRRPLVEAQVGY